MQMVDLKGQYQRIKPEIDKAIAQVVDSCYFINGPIVSEFENSLSEYLGVNHTIGCANGTDALQIALMALDLKPGDEVIVPSFTYVATAEVIGLLGLKPVLIDQDLHTFNVTADHIRPFLSDKTKAIVPVHLFGQSCDMEEIMQLANEHNIYVVEDNAQAIGSIYTFSDGSRKRAGSIGHIATTSFFPAKNLGCFGDGGAIFTNDDALAEKIRMIANHGQSKRYYHDMIGVNSRLDSIQAAVLKVKLNYLDDFALRRNDAARYYDENLTKVKQLEIPFRSPKSDHVFHQYTLRLLDGSRDELVAHLKSKGIPSGIYYPLPLYKQKAFEEYVPNNFSLPITDQLCKEVFSLPIHTELNHEIQNQIISELISFFN